jgi:hypothetical protein
MLWAAQMGRREELLDEALQALRERDIDPQSPGGAVALGFMLGNSPAAAPEATQPSRLRSSEDSPPPPGSADDGDPLAAMGAWSGVDVARLGDFFDFSGGIRLTIPSGRLPKSKASKQRILTLLTLAADRIGNGVSQTGWSHINAVVDDYAVFDQNLGNNVAKNSSLIIRSGKPKTYVYRITQPGLDRARELIQGLATTEEILDP